MLCRIFVVVWFYFYLFIVKMVISNRYMKGVVHSNQFGKYIYDKRTRSFVYV